MSQQINLFNPLFLKQKKHFSAATIAQSSAVLAVAMLGFYAYAVFQVDTLEREAAEAARQQQQQQERLARLTAQVGAQKADPVEEELKSLQSAVAAKQALASALGSTSLGSTSGYSEYMRALARQSVGGLWLTGFRINENGAEVAVSGRAQYPDLVPVFIRKLGNETMMRGRSFEGLVMQSAVQMVMPRDAAKGALPESVQVVDFSFGTSQSAIEALRPEPLPAAADAAIPATAPEAVKAAAKALEAKK